MVNISLACRTAKLLAKISQDRLAGDSRLTAGIEKKAICL